MSSPGPGRPGCPPLPLAWASLRDAMALATIGERGGPPVIVAVNDAFGTLFGVRPEAAEGRELVPFLAPDDRSSLLDTIRTSIVPHGEPATDLSMLQGATRGPSVVEWEIVPVRDEEGTVAHLLAVVGEARSSTMSRPIHKSMDVDPLTGIPNHVHYMSRLERLVEQIGRRTSHGFGVVRLEALELDDVERRLGRTLSNAALEALVWRVERTLRPGDLVARIGRTSLAVLLDRFPSGGSVDTVVDRIREATAVPFTIAGEKISLTVGGVAGPVYDGSEPRPTARAIMDKLESLAPHISGPSGGH